MPSRIMAATVCSCLESWLPGYATSGFLATAARMRSLVTCASSAVRIRKLSCEPGSTPGRLPARTSCWYSWFMAPFLSAPSQRKRSALSNAIGALLAPVIASGAVRPTAIAMSAAGLPLHAAST